MTHVTREFLVQALAGSSGRHEAMQTSNHVLSCPSCRRLARTVVLERRKEDRSSRLGGAMKTLADVFEAEQDEAIEATLAQAEWSSIRSLTPKAQKDRASVVKICKTRSFIRVLLRELKSSNSWTTAESIAALASNCIQSMDPDRYSEQFRKDLRAELWAELANSRRKAAEWTRAKQALARAEELRRDGSLSPELEAICLAVGALIDADQGFIDSSIAALERAWGIYEASEDWHSFARTLIQAANILSEPEPAKSLLLLKRAVPLIPSHDPGLANIARLLRVDCLIWLNQLEEATSVFALCLESHESGRMRVRRDFVAARLLHALGYRKESERLFGEVIAADLESSLFKDAFLDLLYLFGVEVREGDLEAAAQICRRALNEVSLAASSHEQIRSVWSMLLDTVLRKLDTKTLMNEIRYYMATYWRQPSPGVPSVLQKLARLKSGR